MVRTDGDGDMGQKFGKNSSKLEDCSFKTKIHACCFHLKLIIQVREACKDSDRAEKASQDTAG